jgi:formyltetrahydrofolate deformylase
VISSTKELRDRPEPVVHGQNSNAGNLEPDNTKKTATITLIGKDKTGVIAKVTNCLFELGANIEALEEQVLRGQFTMALQASWARSGLDEDVLQARLETLGASLGMETRIRMATPNRLQRMAVMATRETHCPEAILSACCSGALKAAPALVLSNRPDLEPLAKQYDVPFIRIGWHERNPAEVEALRLLDEYEVDFIALARFMKILSPNFVWRYPKKIINIHPSLLPSFPGGQAYRQAWERGVKIAGVTAHFVTMDLDEGPIIAQGSFSISPGMRLPDIVEKGQQLEARILLKALKAYVARRLDVSWGVVSGL